MWFWWFMLICDLLVPLAMVIGGYLMWKHTPKTINGLMGYRTSRSMKNMDTWKFAHEYAGRLWWKIGWIILFPSLVVHMPVYGASDDMVALVGSVLATIQIIILIASIYPTEKALKKNFDDDGSRR
ncbi:MAG: SdpI family protein [Bacteroidales bacterium]|nr:SdpI family protein [Bacteroidales bacterium]